MDSLTSYMGHSLDAGAVSRHAQDKGRQTYRIFFGGGELLVWVGRCRSSFPLYHRQSMTLTAWLRLLERINYKLALMIFPALNCLAPPYLRVLKWIACIPSHSRLQSSTCGCLDGFPVADTQNIPVPTFISRNPHLIMLHIS